MKTIAVIPARFASTRLPGKMLLPLHGVPVVVRTARRAARALRVDQVLVATDDERILRVVEAAGIPGCLTRPDHVSGTDRIVEAVRNLDAELVVNVQGDEPFIQPELIDALVARMQCEDAPAMATARTPIRLPEDLIDPSVVKVVTNHLGHALYFSRSLIPFARDVDPATLLDQGLYFRHLGIYAYRRDFLLRWEHLPPHPLETTEKLEQLRALAQGAVIALLDTDAPAPGIDTPADLQRAENFLREHPEYDT